jgi:hypothetical protein
LEITVAQICFIVEADEIELDPSHIAVAGVTQFTIP